MLLRRFYFALNVLNIYYKLNWILILYIDFAIQNISFIWYKLRPIISFKTSEKRTILRILQNNTAWVWYYKKRDINIKLTSLFWNKTAKKLSYKEKHHVTSSLLCKNLYTFVPQIKFTHFIPTNIYGKKITPYCIIPHSICSHNRLFY